MSDEELRESMAAAIQRLEINLHRAMQGLPLRDAEEAMAESQKVLNAARDAKEAALRAELRRVESPEPDPIEVRLAEEARSREVHVPFENSTVAAYLVEIEADARYNEIYEDGTVGHYADTEKLEFILGDALRGQGIIIRKVSGY